MIGHEMFKCHINLFPRHIPAGKVIGTRNGAILVKLKEQNQAIWFSHLKGISAEC